MPGRERLRKLKSRRVVHKSTGGVLPRTPQPVGPVGNAAATILQYSCSPTGRDAAGRLSRKAPLTRSFGATSPATKRERRTA